MGKKSVKLNYKTRKNSSPDGKSRVYFFCHPDDFETYFEQICNEILQKQNCTIYYKAYRWDSWEKENLETVLGQMDLFVIPVTWKFLQRVEETGSLELQFAREHHIPILPIMYEKGLETMFNKTCGKMQFLDRTVGDDSTAISFEQKLEASLSSLLTDDKLATKIRDSFSARIFLSYRKKDRKLAQQLMHQIHQQELLQDVAIWYDEFLVGGKRFDTSIQKAIEESDIAVFVITPHILENKNYVITHEFPWAKDSGKPILPIMMEPTDKNSLLGKFTDMPDPINGNSIRSVVDALSISLGKLIKKKNKNNSWHLYWIGLAYLRGIDVEKDLYHGLALIRKSAKQNNMCAQYQLGACYDKGNGVAHDREKAVEWYKRAADQGYKDAQVALADLYQTGSTSEQNDEEAFKWYLKAAEGKNGDAVAQYRLGSCYERGIGIEKDENKALEWYKKSAGQENVFALEKIGYLYEKGFPDMKDSEKAIEFYKKASDQGSTFAQCGLGRCYEKGIGVKKDDSQAVDWYKKSAIQGNTFAQCKLGQCYEKGIGIKKDDGQAMEWYKKSARQGNAFAQYKLGQSYEKNKNFEKAVDWYKMSADQGDEFAMSRLGYCCDMLAQTAYRNAFKAHFIMADQGNAYGQYETGVHYENGFGTDRNVEKALEWYIKAYENGYEKAGRACKRLINSIEKQ